MFRPLGHRQYWFKLIAGFIMGMESVPVSSSQSATESTVVQNPG